ncbi:MAG: M48 family metalloprotease [Candidatus Zixiibacteriota bacterium]
MWRAAPGPRAYIIPSKAPNALATGRNPESAAVAVTEGLLELLSSEQLEGVIGHEIAHIMQRDTLLNAYVSSAAGAIGWLAGSLRFTTLSHAARRSLRGGGALFPIILASALAPVAAALIQFGVSRSREFEADRKGAGYTNNYRELAEALRKIQRSPERIDHDRAPEMAHLFLHSSFNRRLLATLFSTHPPVEERAERLERLALSGGGIEAVY